MTNLHTQLTRAVESIGFSKWGIADIVGLHPLAAEFPRALSLALSFGVPFASYDEQAYYSFRGEVRTEFDRKFRQLVEFLQENNIRHLVPDAPHEPGKNLPVFPHKVTATRAGLGWIGKSTLLVTPEFGPRLRLGTILLAEGLNADAPVTESRCGECNRCARACPNGAIKDRLWSPDGDGRELFSSADCSKKREAYIEKIGRAHACGLCLLSCPVGIGGLPA